MKSILLDSNVIIRLFVEDDKKQLAQAKEVFKLIESKETHGIISLLVISEVLWIIEREYKLKKYKIIENVIPIIQLKNIFILETTKEIILNTLEIMVKYNVDFTDAYLFANKGDREISSFDKDFKKFK